MKFVTEKHPVACAIALVIMAIAVTACGNDGVGDPFVADTSVPVSATTSVAGVVSFGSSAAIAGDDSSEPIAVNAADLATSETDEPDPKV